MPPKTLEEMREEIAVKKAYDNGFSAGASIAFTISFFSFVIHFIFSH